MTDRQESIINGDRGNSPDNSETDSVNSQDKEKERKGSTCKTIRPLPVFVKVESQDLNKEYIKKIELSDLEREHNEKLFEDTMTTQFPEERMNDMFYRDKDKEMAIRSWILSILEEEENPKTRKKSSTAQEVEELNFLLKSGIVLCKLMKKIYPKCGIEVETLQTGNLNTKKKNISQFIVAAIAYGIHEKYLFKPDDLVVMAHFHKVTRALFALAERTKMDPNFSGPYFDIELAINPQSLKRKLSGNQEKVNAGTLNAIFENLMQDVERKTSVVSKGPPKNIYSCD